jgi:hypothetical protein
MAKLAQVIIEKSGGHNMMSVDEFKSIPTSKKIELALANKITFLDENGDIMPLTDGVRWIKENS